MVRFYGYSVIVVQGFVIVISYFAADTKFIGPAEAKSTNDPLIQLYACRPYRI